MTTMTLASPAAATIIPERPGPVRTLRHALALSKRNLITLWHTPQLLIADAIRPILITLLFDGVLGGSIALPGGEKYVTYLIPGIMVQQVIFASSLTASGLATDLSSGILDRFRALPIARSAYLSARIISDILRILVSVILVALVGLALGFRFTTGPLPVLGALVLIIGTGVAFSWIGAVSAMKLKNPETVTTAWILMLIPLIFASSVFASPARMPGWLQPVVKANPLSVVADATRALLLGSPVGTHALWSVVWIVGITVVTFTWAVRAYRNIQ